ncbi:MAG: efflux transporter periplasmic adaptor subunit, partial [Gammaproteobacteria bacterium]|nr:efflux transporter periplasmic adaptor subunit [Gammaproteobacteria bacterium]
MRIVLRFALPILVLIAAIAAAWTLAVSRPQVAQVPVAPPALLVEVGTAERVPVTYTVRSQGTVTPRTSTTLISEVSGNIVDVAPAFVSGGFFRKGDVLVRIDPRTYRTNVKRASAAVARAQTQVATENALAGYAFQDWQRLRSLDAATGPASDLTLRKPQLAEAIAGLESAEADMEQAVEDLRRTIIRAPYDGMVRSKRADVG